MHTEKAISLVDIKESLSGAFKVIAENHQEKGILPNSLLVLIDYPEHNSVVGLGHPVTAAASLAHTTEAHYQELKQTLLDNEERNTTEAFNGVRKAFNEQIETLVAALREAKL